MKIVQILPELNAGGVERGTLEIAASLVREGHQAIVVSNGGRLVEVLEKSGARHVAMPVHRKSLATLFQVRAMRKILTTEKPDIVHIRSRVPGWVTWLAWRGMDPATRPRLVSTVHGFYSINFYSAIMARGERVIAVSNCIRDYILENYPKTPPEIIRIIPRGIEPENYGVDFQPAADWLDIWQSEHPTLAGKCVLLLPGRITRLKGHGDFFNLIAALKSEGIPVHGLVAGDTHAKKQDYMDELKETVNRLGLSNELTFLGHRGDIREVMSVSDIVLALSQQPESFGRTVLEAMALGKPVVGYDCGGVGELLAELFPAGRVPLGNAAELLEVTRAVIRNHPAPSPVGEPFTLDAMCRATLGVYQELARSPR
ncbi:MAG: glycosyltransferase family 4 protein [Verrucomicrobiota bacterium]